MLCVVVYGWRLACCALCDLLFAWGAVCGVSCFCVLSASCRVVYVVCLGWLVVRRVVRDVMCACCGLSCALHVVCCLLRCALCALHSALCALCCTVRCAVCAACCVVCCCLF